MDCSRRVAGYRLSRATRDTVKIVVFVFGFARLIHARVRQTVIWRSARVCRISALIIRSITSVRFERPCESSTVANALIAMGILKFESGFDKVAYWICMDVARGICCLGGQLRGALMHDAS
jgi:hypothetical protein